MADEQMTAWFCRQVEELTQTMYVLSLGILKNDTDAQDAMQNALLLAYRHLEELRTFEKFKPWLLRILTRECWRLAELRQREAPLPEARQGTPAPTPDIDTRLTLWQAVQALSPDHRTVILLYYYEDMPLADIAKALDISPAAAKKRLSRAREQLRGALRQEDFL